MLIDVPKKQYSALHDTNRASCFRVYQFGMLGAREEVLENVIKILRMVFCKFVAFVIGGCFRVKSSGFLYTCGRNASIAANSFLITSLITLSRVLSCLSFNYKTHAFILK